VALGSQPLRDEAETLLRRVRARSVDEVAWSPLTAREVEVARHIARGETNAQIAIALGVSPRTVTAHVEHILAKLGAGRRAEVAAWVVSVAGAEAPGDPPRTDP
jgi:DNA-binding CsgD family transcriptional regulator